MVSSLARRLGPLVLSWLAACAPVFDNPLDPQGGRGLGELHVTQVGIDAVEVRWAPLAHPGVRGFRLLRRRPGASETLGLDVPAAASAIRVAGVEPGEWAWSLVALDAAGRASRPSPERVAGVTATPPVVAALHFENFDTLVARWPAPPGWVARVRLELSVDGAPPVVAEVPADLTTRSWPATAPHAYRLRTTPADSAGTLGSPWFSEEISLAGSAPAHVGSRRPAWAPDSATVSWSPVEGAQGYRLFVREGDGLEPGVAEEVTRLDEVGTGTDRRLSTTVLALDPTRRYVFHVAAVSPTGAAGALGGPAVEDVPAWTLVQSEALPDVLPEADPRGAFVDPQRPADVYVAYADDEARPPTVAVYRFPVAPLAGAERVASAVLPRALSPGVLRVRDDVREWLLPFARDTHLPGESPHMALALDRSNVLSVVDTVAADPSIGVPRAAGAFAVAGDPSTAALFLAGGVPGAEALWRLDLALPSAPRWTRLLADVPEPTTRALVARDGALVRYAPQRSAGSSPSDLWAWSPSDGGYRALSVALGGEGPPPRTGGASALVHRAGRTYLLGGFEEGEEQSRTPTSDVWAFDETQAAWSRREAAGEVPAAGPMSAVDPGASIPGRFLVFSRGGASLLSPDTGSWVHLPPPAPARLGASIVAGAAGDAFVFGGATRDGRLSNALVSVSPTDLPATRPIVTTGAAPAARRGALLATDEDALYLFGGVAEQPDDAVWRRREGAWQQLAVARGELPAPIALDALAVSAANGTRRLLALGGRNAASDATGNLYAAPLDSGSWRLQAAVGARPVLPSARQCSSSTFACFAPGAAWGVSIVENAAGGGRQGAWVVELSGETPTWSAAGTPGPTGCLVALACVERPAERAVYMLAKEGGGTVWRLDLSASPRTWKPLALGPGGPAARAAASFAWVPRANALLLGFGGDAPATAHADWWRLDLE